MNTIILNGSDVLYLEVAIGSTNITQRSIGRLDNIDEDIVDIEAITWNRHTLFVVALVSRYNVYWAKNDSDNGIMVPIEHIALHGEHQKIVLFGHGGELFGLIGNVVRSGEFRYINALNWSLQCVAEMNTNPFFFFYTVLQFVCTNGVNLTSRYWKHRT